ncbi:MAG: hypothetical protein HYW15_01755 [Candidatus Giovannonibacteria bacterium]|nr:MAG: hypothetical protein HYW15_01755 [Candidatus Giovannonibacteria bacterium]
MFIVSHHLFKNGAVESLRGESAVTRVNVAWLREKSELEDLLNKTAGDIYLDYPSGRSKPPLPTISLDDVLELVPRYKQIKHFAVSNVETPLAIAAIKNRLPGNINLVPKIETKAGVEKLAEIIDSILATHIMFDKDDLYVNVLADNKLFEELVERARKTCREKGVKILELQGVVFAPRE